MPLDENVISQIPEETRNDPAFAEISKSDIPSIVKNLVDSQKSLGRAVLLPDEKDPDDKRSEKLNAVYGKLGRPESPDKYDFSSVLQEGQELDPDRAGRWTKRFHELGLNNHQASELIKEALAEGVDGGLSKESFIEAMTEDWGEGDDFVENVGVAQRALQAYDEEGEFLKLLEDTGLGNHPAVGRFLHKIGSSTKEGTTPARTEQRSGNMTKETAQTKVSEIMNNKEHPYHDKSKSGHAEAVQEVYRLNQIIFGTEKVAHIGL